MRNWGDGSLTAVPQRRPICESDRERVFDVPGSCLFRSEVTAPDGTVKVFEGIRAYVDSMTVSPEGRVVVSIKSKSSNVRSGRIAYPYNCVCGDVLCVMKLNEMRIKSTDGEFVCGLTYNLFCLPWRTCVLMNGGDGLVTVTGRGEWERGELNSYNQEVQMFLPVPRGRQVPHEMVRPIVNEGITRWMDDCLMKMRRKGA